MRKADKNAVSKQRQNFFSKVIILKSRYHDFLFNLKIADSSQRDTLIDQISFCKKEIQKLIDKIWKLDRLRKKQRTWARGSKLNIESFLKQK